MATNQAGRTAIEWSPVIAGTVVALAVSIVLVQFGQALGLTFTNLNTDDLVTPNSLLAFGLWVLWTQLSASVTGGYVAGRMITHGDNTREGELRDGAHGVLVWALASVLTAIGIAVVAGFSAIAAAQGVAPEGDVVVGLSDAMAKKVGIIAGFSIAASSLVSAVAAWAVAIAGGDHRDNKRDVSGYVRFRRTK